MRVEPFVHLRGAKVLRPCVAVADRTASCHPDQPLQREFDAVPVQVKDRYGQAIVRSAIDPVARSDLGCPQVPPGDGQIILVRAAQDGDLVVMPLRPGQVEEVVKVGHPSSMNPGCSQPPQN